MVEVLRIQRVDCLVYVKVAVYENLDDAISGVLPCEILPVAYSSSTHYLVNDLQLFLILFLP